MHDFFSSSLFSLYHISSNRYIANSVKKVLGVDTSEAMLSKLKEKNTPELSIETCNKDIVTNPLDDKFDGIFEIETIKLKGKSFYTDVENLKNVLDRVFSEIEKRKKFNKIEVEMIEYDDYNYMDLTITQIGSSANRTKEEMEKISNGGDMAEIKRSLRNLCDWSVEMSHDDKSYRIDYLGKIDSDTEIETRGFTHRFRFYR